MKVIAMYLPQFHRISENDAWWGEGYTEWTAVKNAEKLYKNHYQPHIPLNNNYYDLLQKQTMQWQSELMKKYDVYGMCFYHYYFQNGKRILEKPAENLLNWKDIDMPFCFSWANETWARTWSKVVGKNTWNCLKEGEYSEDDDGILLRQDYGEERDWEKHFNYLLPFFMDDRYIKVGNKPIFLIHKPDSITCLGQMIEKWNELAYKNGMEGIYFVASNSDRNGFDAYLRQEPNYSHHDIKSRMGKYDELCQRIVDNAASADNNCYLCGFPGYDDTPRRGETGEIIENASPKKFYNLMKSLFWLGDIKGMEFTFINAWNEWGEGMYLEPDEKYGYGYLQALKSALSDYRELDKGMKQNLAALIYKNFHETKALTEDNPLKKSRYLMQLFNKWLCLKEKGKTLQPYFGNKNYKDIAIYGLGMAGNHLLADLEKSSVKIAYGIDRLGNHLKYHFPIYTMDQELPTADIIVVSVIYDFDNIYKDLKGKFSGPIISLSEIVDYVEMNDTE